MQTSAGYLSGLGTPWTSGVDLQEYQRRGQRLSAVSTGSAEDTVFRDSAPPSELAATVIQSWYRGHRLVMQPIQSCMFGFPEHSKLAEIFKSRRTCLEVG